MDQRLPQETAPSSPSSESDLTGPSNTGLWLATAALFVTYFAAQLVIVIPVISWWAAEQGLQSTESIEELIFSDSGLWLTLIATGISALLVILVAFVWPRIWRAVSSGPHLGLDEWFAWLPSRYLPLWTIPFGTLGLAFLGSSIVYAVSGNPEVEAQAALFSTPSLQIATTLIVSSIVPVAEELIFRGAMYQALEVRHAPSALQRHGLAVVVTSLSFAAVHLLAGFETFASVLLITVFSLFLGSLRALTGSVQTTVISHAVWNVMGSLAFVASNNLPS